MQNREFAEAKIEEKPVAESVSIKGLCEVCALAPGCTYARNPEVPVLQCAEFEGYGPRPESSQQRNAQQRAGRPDRQPPEPEPANLKGLCVNCDRRFTCTYAKPETGVWRCEEYE